MISTHEARSRERRERPKLELAEIRLKKIADGFDNAVALADPMDGRLLVLDQVGKVYAVDKEKGEKQLVLDITHKVVKLNPGYDERGLLGIALHPDFRSNRRLFLFYSAPLREGGPDGWNCTSHLAEYRMTADDPKRIDESSERIIFTVDKPQSNHNGGHITFGPDGYLYIPLGDGGGADDKDEGHTPVIGNAQDLNVLLGKMLRIDIDRKSEWKEYAIPESNPFAKDGGLPEIFAYGLRNPYSISFDAGGDQELFAGDVGQHRWESVDIVRKGGNYGWNLKEGTHWFDPERDLNTLLGARVTGYMGEGLIDPIMEYANLSNRTGGIGSAVIGGYVYRGSSIPFLQGRYVFGDLNGKFDRRSGRLFVGSPPSMTGEGWVLDELSIEGRKELGEYVLAFGEDSERELYLLSSDSQGPSGKNSRVYKIMLAGA